ncbi:helix-turn-helix domain-containing protein [Cochlodiniinecator piscidefendens]|uniref:helix-turn-helix domain-containing protein n=1 Tax=Cochlodiniinecator piscidefendens TaxID=2715756 RepID=UPI00140B7CC2|nr:helix-turn-helix domain-containing protein [Cochlodiniinecator piscidefendens]
MTKYLAPESPYDAETEEDDLWFLPPMPEGVEDELRQNPTMSELRGDWVAAEHATYPDLLRAAEALSRLRERLSWMPKEVGERLAVQSTVALLRQEGHWITADQLAVYMKLGAAPIDQAQDFARGAWAVRRLLGALTPQQGVHGFLGRQQVQDDGLSSLQHRPVGAELETLGTQWADTLASVFDLHRITQSAVAFFEWQRLGLSDPEDSLEGSVAAMCFAAGDGILFQPIAPDASVMRSGAAAERLARWFRAVETGCLQALLELERLNAWRSRAGAATQGMSGRSVGLLIETLLAVPLVSAELLEARTGLSRPSALRNLNAFSDLGLLREVTGQRRYRFWTARLLS